MILTGMAIRQAVANGDIVIEPFDEASINPNSYNYRLGDTLVDVGHGSPFRISADGYILRPGHLYLGHTREILGSRTYAMSLLGRSLAYSNRRHGGRGDWPIIGLYVHPRTGLIREQRP